MTLIKRAAAAQATLDEWRGKPFRLGERDCARVAAAHLRRMGHTVKLPAKGSYRTLKSAKRELEKRGAADMPGAMDAMGFARIAPAAALPGDIVALPGMGDLGALTVAMGNGRVAGYHEDAAGLEVLQPVEFVAAWRVDPTK